MTRRRKLTTMFFSISRPKHIADCGLSDEGYTAFFKGVKKACNDKIDVCSNHDYKTAVSYLQKLMELIKWACTRAD